MRTVEQTWWIYLALGNNGQLYCGISTDPIRRIKEHNGSKKGAKWAKAHRPLKLVWAEQIGSRSEASKREHKIKTMSVAQKWKIVYSN